MKYKNQKICLKYRSIQLIIEWLVKICMRDKMAEKVVFCENFYPSEKLENPKLLSKILFNRLIPEKYLRKSCENFKPMSTAN